MIPRLSYPSLLLLITSTVIAAPHLSTKAGLHLENYPRGGQSEQEKKFFGGQGHKYKAMEMVLRFQRGGGEIHGRGGGWGGGE